MVEDDVGSDAEVEPVPDVRRSRAAVSYAESDEDDETPPPHLVVGQSVALALDALEGVVTKIDGDKVWVKLDDDRDEWFRAEQLLPVEESRSVPQGRGEKRKAPTSSKPTSSKRPRRSGNVDEDYQPTAGDAEEDEEDEEE